MTNTLAEDFFAKAITAANAGDAAGMEANFRTCLVQDPNHALALLNLGIVLTNRGEYGEAESLLLQAVKLLPTVDTVTALANLFEAAGRPGKAQECYQDILKVMPDHAPTLKHIAGMFERNADDDMACEYYRRAWAAAPADIDAGISYAYTAYASNPAATTAVMDKLLTDNIHDDAARLKILNKLMILKEFHERAQHGLMPHHATSLDELFFTYCAPEFAVYRELALKRAEQNPDDANALLGKFTALFCSRDRRGAQECLDRLLPAIRNHVWETVTFDPAFYRNIEAQSDADIVSGLPPLIEVMPAVFTKEHITYLSCNFAYFVAFAMPLIRSFADRSPGGQLHVHIMDATDEQLNAAAAFCRGLGAVTIAVSAERPGVDKQGQAAARSYYHAIRFIRFYQYLKHYGRTLWMMDVDAIFNRDAHEMYDVIGGKDAAFRIRAGRLEPWNQFSAGVIGATGKPASLAYFRLVAGYIAYFYKLNKMRWGIDQLAMYGAYEYLNDAQRAPTLAFLDDRVMDQEYLDKGIVWFTAGKKKFSPPTVDANASLSGPEAKQMKYWRAFNKYNLPEAPTGPS